MENRQDIINHLKIIKRYFQRHIKALDSQIKKLDHEERLNKFKDKSVVCLGCGFRFKTIKELDIHMKSCRYGKSTYALKLKKVYEEGTETLNPPPK